MYERREVVTPVRPTAVAEHVETVTDDPFAPNRGAAEKLRQAILLLFGIVNCLIGIRFVLRLLGANPDAPFATFIHGVTAPLLAPFVGLFGTPAFTNGSVLEWHSLVAIVVYLLIAWALTKLVWIVAGETRRGTRAAVHRVDTEAP
jgi:hypothetical protein